MADTNPIPASYQQWRECITVRCGLPLPADYIEDRLRELRDAAHPRTVEFVRKYGEAYAQQIIRWFEQAARAEFPYYEWQGPSRSFREHDTDGTGTISLQEWAKRNGDEKGFHMGDCNGDQVRTWHEYHQLRFWGRRCPSY